MTETTIPNLHTCFYIPENQKLAFHIPHIQIQGTNHCGESLELHLNAENHFKMCYVAMIILGE